MTMKKTPMTPATGAGWKETHADAIVVGKRHADAGWKEADAGAGWKETRHGQLYDETHHHGQLHEDDGNNMKMMATTRHMQQSAHWPKLWQPQRGG